MAISVFELFKIGIGPSSSHTVGPMIAAGKYLHALQEQCLIDKVKRLKLELFGSLGATGKGHGSDKAIVLGLLGEQPDTVDTETFDSRFEHIRDNKKLCLNGQASIDFDLQKDLVFHQRKSLPEHPNAMRFTSYDIDHQSLLVRQYYSVGGGFVYAGRQHNSSSPEGITSEVITPEVIVPELDKPALAYPFSSAAELMDLCRDKQLSISQLMMENELAWHPEAQIHEKLLAIWQVMQDSVNRGCQNTGLLPGGMRVKRRAADLYAQLLRDSTSPNDPMKVMDWVDVFAMAVNEENAAGGRIVTAPTNGAAGIIPAVLHYYWKFCDGYTPQNVVRFLLTAAAIGILFKVNASISGAEVGCQGEVGSACSMAAAGLTEVLGGSPAQVENAAEIGMEHNLGLTCDPVGGLVQVPCIERNAMAAVKAINASRMALLGDGRHFVSLDKVIKTMRETGADMKTKYKETARGGLAVNVIEC